MAMVLALSRSPADPSSGLLGIGVPERGRSACSDSAACEENSAISAEKTATEIQGRQVDRTHPPMTLPLQQLPGARHTQRYAPPHCYRVWMKQDARCPRDFVTLTPPLTVMIDLHFVVIRAAARSFFAQL